MGDEKRSSRLKGAWKWLGPASAVGLYGGRLLSELIHPGAAGAILITLALLIPSDLVVRRYAFGQTWPLLLLVLYVIYPEADPRVAAAIGLFSLFTTLLYNFSRGDQETPQSSRSDLVAAAIGFIFLALYWITIAQDVLPADSGELQLIAAKLGVAHPPGFPLYTLIANFFTRLPFEANSAFRVNLFSAFASAAALSFVYLTVKVISSSSIGGIIAAAALGTSTTYWALATTTNIRSLTALFVALAFYAFVSIWNLKDGEESSLDLTPAGSAAGLRRPYFGYLILFFLAVAFGVSHHLSILFIALVLIIGLILSQPHLLKTPAFWLIIGFSAVMALLPLTYLPIRAAAGAQGAPDDLNSLSGLLNHVLALGFRGDFFYFSEPALLWERMKVMTNVLTFQFAPLLLLGMFVGFVLMAVKDWRLASVFAGSCLLHTLISAMYRAPQTVEYMLPVYIPAAILLGYGAGLAGGKALEKASGQSRNTTRALSAVYVSALLISVLFQFSKGYRSYSYLHNDVSTRVYAETILRNAPESSVVLADWHWATPIWYLQQVEKQRPDLEVHFVFPTDEPYADTWARRIGDELEAGRQVVATHYNEAAYQNLPTPEPMGEAFLFGQDLRHALPDGFTPMELVLGEELRIHGYHIPSKEFRLDEELVVTVAWERLDGGAAATNLFGQIVDPADRLIAADDQPLRNKLPGINLTQFRLTPRPGAFPGDFSLLIGAYGEEPLLDEVGQERAEAANLKIAAGDFEPVSTNPTRRNIVGSSIDKRLVGYDWDNTLPDQTRLYIHWESESGYYSETIDLTEEGFTLPDYYGPWGIPIRHRIIENKDSDSHYVPFGQGIVWMDDVIDPDLEPGAGRRIGLNQHFASTMPVLRDLVVSTRLVGYEADGFHWAWWDLDDSIPAMGAIPTLKWIAGSKIRDPHWVTVAQTAEHDQEISPLLRLYDAFTGRAVPILDERISEQYPWVPLGNTGVK